MRIHYAAINRANGQSKRPHPLSAPLVLVRIIRREIEQSQFPPRNGTRISEDRRLIMRGGIADGSAADKWHQQRFLLKWDINAYSLGDRAARERWMEFSTRTMIATVFDSRANLTDRASTVFVYTYRVHILKTGKKYPFKIDRESYISLLRCNYHARTFGEIFQVR